MEWRKKKIDEWIKSQTAFMPKLSSDAHKLWLLMDKMDLSEETNKNALFKVIVSLIKDNYKKSEHNSNHAWINSFLLLAIGDLALYLLAINLGYEAFMGWLSVNWIFIPGILILFAISKITNHFNLTQK
ncbi:MAG: hypothetical protein EAX96_20440 [Candidatus Lokiarchaeota archaeon]|nr:hypothetical protein [Candidatus Lokiarchaeota archaeon]